MRKLPVIIVSVVMAGSLAACGSSSSGGTTPTSTPKSTAPAAAAPNGITDPTAAKAAITAAYEHAFKTGDPKGQDYIETPAKIAGALKFAAGLAKKSKPQSAMVVSVKITDASDASVTYNLLSGGKTLLPNATGTAVFSEGGWKLSDVTLCGLLQLATTKKLQGC